MDKLNKIIPYSSKIIKQHNNNNNKIKNKTESQKLKMVTSPNLSSTMNAYSYLNDMV